MQSVDIETVRAYLTARYPQRAHLGDKELGELLDDLLELGYAHVEELNEVLERWSPALERYEIEHPGSGLFPDVAAVRLTLAIARPDFYERKGYANNDLMPSLRHRFGGSLGKVQ